MENYRKETMLSGKITLVSSNLNKVRDLSELLDVKLDHANIELVEAQGLDVAEVVKEKALSAYKILKKPVLVDDAGLTLNAWGKLPGALIKYFIHSVGVAGIIKMLDGFDDKTGYMSAALGYADENGVKIYVGKVDGKISSTVKGDAGWGYDVIFIPDGEKETCSEIKMRNPAKYWYYSARKRATDKMKQALQKEVKL